MITAALITILVSVAELIGLLIPNIPNTPEAISAMGDQAVIFVQGSLALVGMIFTIPLAIAVFTVTIARLNFHFVYIGIQWVWRKIPFLNSIKI